MLESEYQAKLIKRLELMFPGCWIIKNDANVLQGVPDLTIHFGNKYAMLEVKASEKSRVRPNQEYYVQRFGQMTFCSFIYPENEEEVLYALQQALSS